jgi:hypothetical protein
MTFYESLMSDPRRRRAYGLGALVPPPGSGLSVADCLMNPRRCIEDAVGDATGGAVGSPGDNPGRTPEERAIAAVIREVIFTNNFTPRVAVSIDEILHNNGAKSDNSDAVKAMQPTIFLRGPLIGERVIAPAGMADPDAWKMKALTVGAIGVGGLLLGAALAFAGGWYVRGRRG